MHLSVTIWVILLVANAPVYWLLYKLLFADGEEFLEGFKAWATPPMRALAAGNLADGLLDRLKFGFWVLGSIGCVFGEAKLIDKWFY